MTEITLTQGKVALIDDADLPLVSGFRWHAFRPSKFGCYYAGTGQPRVYMHRLIMGAAPGEEVDHCNGDGLDNRRSNLRLTTHALNMANQRPRQGTSSRFKGVSRYHRPRANGQPCWQAYIKVQGHRRNLGYFDIEEDAARAYDAAALATWGEYARLNFAITRWNGAA